MSHRQRRKKFIDAKVQGALAQRILFHWLTFVLVAFSTAFFFQVLSNPFLPLKLQFRSLWWAQGPFLLILAFLLPVFLFDTVKLSHRFAGPICRLRSAMRAIAAGERPTKLSFRDNDFWHELADEYNAMLEKLTDGELPCETESDKEFEPAGARR